MQIKSFAFAILSMVLVLAVCASRGSAAAERAWDGLPVLELKGGLKVFWNVIDHTKGENDAAAIAHGFQPLTILGTYADYPGNNKEHIGVFLGSHPNNPWNKPPYFERIIRRNIADTKSTGTYVQDIEIDFVEDVSVAFADPAVRAASGANDLREFEEKYFKEWATWFWLPLKWTKDQYPDSAVGIYGPQPFRRDYWGISGKNLTQIDGSHKNDWTLWRYIDTYVDFYVSSVYIYYANPDSILYMASNVEENYIRTRSLSTKPVYAYEWLRYHSGNWRERNRELDPYHVEAMAIVPYFSGATGIVLWGYEPDLKPGDGRPYANLPLFMQNLARVAGLSEKIGRGRIVFDEPAHVSWKAKRPLIRNVVVSPTECIVMAVNPWQDDSQRSQAQVKCGDKTVQVDMSGRHTALYHIEDGRLTPH